MSGGQKHRDPWNFPDMKWRARNRLTGSQRLAVLRRSQRLAEQRNVAEYKACRGNART